MWGVGLGLRVKCQALRLRLRHSRIMQCPEEERTRERDRGRQGENERVKGLKEGPLRDLLGHLGVIWGLLRHIRTIEYLEGTYTGIYTGIR